MRGNYLSDLVILRRDSYAGSSENCLLCHYVFGTVDFGGKEVAAAGSSGKYQPLGISYRCGSADSSGVDLSSARLQVRGGLRGD